MQPLRIIFAASGEFGLPTLGAMLDAGHEIVQVISQPDRPAGRGRTLTPTPIAAAAEAHGLPVIRTGDINGLSLPSADVMVVIAFGQKIANAIVHHPRLGSINLHASRLPKYRGAAPINWAILGGETVTGNSIIRLAQKMDAGAILAQSELTIGELETAGELHDRLAADGAALVLHVLEGLANETLDEMEQDHARATLAPKLSRQAARIDWEKDADQIARHIRGLHPWPGCRMELLDGEQATDTVTLVRARPVDGQPRGDRPAAPGTIVNDGVATGDGHAVEIVEVQPAGKRPMPLDAYRRGHRWEPGMRVRSL